MAAGIVLALLGAAPAAFALNVAGPLYGGIGICGVNSTATLAALGTPRANSGTTANINDGNATTRVDTWFGGNAGTYSYAGILWPFQRADSVKTLTLNIACFGDGGWFGFAGVSPSPGGVLTSVSHLIEPSVQVTADGGVTWSAVDIATDYLTQLENHNIGGGGFPNPNPKSFTITLNTPVSGINGIRIIGENGGLAGTDVNGFLGIMEIEVDAGPVVDTDNDGMEDSWEDAHGGKENLTLTGDLDADGLLDVNEFLANVDPQDTDSDNDGLNDGPEVLTHQTNPGDSDTDDDGLSDGAEVNTHGTSPRSADTDADGLTDPAEINTHGTQPTNRDTDGDGFSDGQEVLTFLTLPLDPASRIANIARAGNAHFGYNNALDGDNGTTYSQQGTTAAVLNRIIDGNLTNRIDTYNATSTNPVSFAGVRWAAAWPQPVNRLELTMACFQDGGWFGPSNASPGPGNPLVSPTHVTEPTIQTTTDGNAWTTVAHTSTYLTEFTGHRIGGGGQPNPTSRRAVFTLTTPAAGIRGVRIIGSEGGVAGNTGSNRGFIGVFELVIQDTTTSNDLDNDGLTNAQETTLGTNPEDDDSDDDGLLDGAEVNLQLTDPLDNDSDNDRFRDGQEVALGSNPLSALSFPDNPALIGTGIMGVNDALDSDAGTSYSQAGVPANINDGNLTTRVDTYNGTATTQFSYAGLTFPGPQTVTSIRMTFATFFDGGWFGPNGFGPGNGGTLGPEHLEEPNVQVTSDGVTWTTVSHSSDYLTALTGHTIGNTAGVNPSTVSATFTLNSPALAVSGIRLIGHEGGTASGGFLGCFEILAFQNGTPGDMDNDGLPDAWEVTKFGWVHAQHPLADGDFDGSDTLLESAFSMDLAVPDQPPGAQLEGDYLTMTITKVPGIAYSVLSGSDGAGFSMANTTVIIDDATTLKVRDNTPIGTGPRRFLKTEVSPAP
jgi:hypothetical protein